MSFAAALEELRRRAAGEPGVAGVTFVDELPLENHPERWVELDVGLGVAAGFILVTTAAFVMSGHRRDGATRAPDGGLSLGHVGLLAAHAAFMLGVCLLACVVPTWRALRVDPTEALRAE